MEDMSLEKAAEIVRNAFLYDKELYKALVESIESALIDSTNEMLLGEVGKVATNVANRIINKGGLNDKG